MQQPSGLEGDENRVPDHGEESYVGSGRLVGRRALVTGADSGIGRAVAIAFAREGADVALSYPPDEQDDAELTADFVRAAGRRVALLPGDLTDEETASDLPQRAVDGLGALDILVNNAGFATARRPGIDDLATEELDRVVRTNLYALLWVTQAAIKHLPRGAVIINTASVQADEPSPTLVDLDATKAAILNVTVNLAAELGPRGIRVNAVAPGPIWTPRRPPAAKTFGTSTPIGRAGQPAEVAPAFVFLASQRDASYVSGTVLGVTGGRPVFGA
jgi:NAD(P)-dependent dehydrogenase (short-subunit alcohol dehydrogenase family)